MAIITMRIYDTPSGGIETYTDFAPKVGQALTPAQNAANEIIRRTRREYGLPVQAPEMSKAAFFVVGGQGGQTGQGVAEA